MFSNRRINLIYTYAITWMVILNYPSVVTNFVVSSSPSPDYSPQEAFSLRGVQKRQDIYEGYSTLSRNLEEVEVTETAENEESVTEDEESITDKLNNIKDSTQNLFTATFTTNPRAWTGANWGVAAGVFVLAFIIVRVVVKCFCCK